MLFLANKLCKAITYCRFVPKVGKYYFKKRITKNKIVLSPYKQINTNPDELTQLLNNGVTKKVRERPIHIKLLWFLQNLQWIIQTWIIQQKTCRHSRKSTTVVYLEQKTKKMEYSTQTVCTKVILVLIYIRNCSKLIADNQNMKYSTQTGCTKNLSASSKPVKAENDGG